MANAPRITVIGGGTGTFTLLSGLKHHHAELSAVVSIADDGGSTGVLRDELGVLPPGDIRQCLVALSEADEMMRSLFTYRFSEGSLSGHVFGNVFLSALEKVTQDPLRAIEEAHHILSVRGEVIPAAACAGVLCAELTDGRVVTGQHVIDESAADRAAITRCYLSPAIQANPKAIESILQADLIVLGPGDLYTSVIPVLLVDGIAQALKQTQARIAYVGNLVTKRGQTDGYTVSRYVQALESAMSGARIASVLLHNAPLPDDIRERYALVGEYPVVDDLDDSVNLRVVREDIVSATRIEQASHDAVRRSLLRHDSDKLARAVMQLATLS